MDFDNNNYYHKKFKKLNLTKQIIKDLEFEECQFFDCSFVDCKLERCRFYNCKFEDSMLSAIIPTDSLFVEVKFVKSKVIGFDWTKTENIQEISFTNCQINYSNFRLLKLPKLIMTDCEAKEVDFTETNLAEGNFQETDFEKTIFFKTILTKADFRGATNYYIDARLNNIKKAYFSLPEALALLNSLDIIID